MKFRLFIGIFSLVLLLGIVSVVAWVFLSVDPVTIRFTSWAIEDEARNLEALIATINASQDEYDIVHVPIPVDYNVAVQAQIIAGDGVDLYWIDNINMGVSERGLFLPLTECIADAAPQTVGDLNDYDPDVLTYTKRGEEIYGLPFVVNPVVTYYNKNLFDAAGLPYPSSDWNWDDFINTAKALTKDNNGDGSIDQWGFAANGWPPPHIFIWQAGGEVLSPDLLSSPIDSPEALTGFEFYRQLSFNPEFSPDRNTIAEIGLVEMFEAGHVAMYMGNADEGLDYIEGMNIGLVRVPANPQTGSHTTYAWSAAMVMNATTAYPDIACDALLALTDALQQQEVVSPRISHATVERIAAAEPRKAAHAQAIIEAASDMRVMPSFATYQDWNREIWAEYFMPWTYGDISGTKVAEAFGSADTLVIPLSDYARAARQVIEEFLPDTPQ